MSEYTKQKSLYADVQRALWTEWDPIGLRAVDPDWPSSEYDGYAAVVLRELSSGSGEEGLARLLGHIEVESMGLPPRPLRELLEAARRVRAALAWKDSSAAT